MATPLLPRDSGRSAYALLALPLDPKIGGPEQCTSAARRPGSRNSGRTGGAAATVRVDRSRSARRGGGITRRRPAVEREELVVSANTVLTDLERVFETTGTHRQAELVRVLTAVLSGTGQFVELCEK